MLASAEKLMATSPFLVTSVSEISLLMVPPGTQDRIVRAFRAAGTKVERARRSKRGSSAR